MKNIVKLVSIFLLAAFSSLIACGSDSEKTESTSTLETTIVFHSNFGNNEIKTQTVELNETVNLEINTFEREGHSFIGWSLSTTGAVVHENGASYTADTANINLYARWVANTYIITFDGTGVPTLVEVVFGSPMPSLGEQTAPTKEGLYFVGYFDAETGGTRYYTSRLTSARIWDKTSGATLYAQWREDIVYELGDTGPGDGIIFYVSEEGFAVPGYGTAYYLEAASDDMDTELAWGGQGVSINGTGLGIGIGRDNTDRILSILSLDGNRPAALFCRNYTGGGKTDWFLPSRDELNQLYLQKDIVGGFNEMFMYWSSSEYHDSLNAWGQSFSTGSQEFSDKAGTGRVRAVRAF